MNNSQVGSGAHDENVARLRVLAHAFLEWNGGSDAKLSAFLMSKGTAMGLPTQDVKRVIDEAGKGYRPKPSSSGLLSRLVGPSTPVSRRLSSPSGQGHVGSLGEPVLTVFTHALQVATGEAGPRKDTPYPERNLPEEVRNLNEREYRYLIKVLDLIVEAIQTP